LIHVDTESFFVIVLSAAVAAATVAFVPGRFVPPVVVIELGLGILIGPHVLSIASEDEFIEFFSNLGLGMLFFFAGYEIDFERIKGEPLKLGAWAGGSRSSSPMSSERCSRRPAWSSPPSTRAPRWRRRRSAR
jgi:Kef-type K+ transport system membrane component KefB